VGVISPAKRQWLVREFPELSNCFQQTVQSDLTIFDCLSDAVFRDSLRELLQNYQETQLRLAAIRIRDKPS
jgi:hypothetical protein